MDFGFDYYIFVDASGDDGLKFDNGSSSCYVASSVIVHKDDVEHNATILSNIKSLMGAKDNDEVKYSKARRHPKSQVIHKLIHDVKASAYSAVVFKQRTTFQLFLDPATKALSSFSHASSIISMGSHFAESPDVSVQIIIDRMKTTEESAVTALLELYNFDISSQKLPDYSVIYKDSKAKGYELIQLADMVAGATRVYFENHTIDKDLNFFWLTCPICNTNKKLCRSRRKPHPAKHPFLYTLPLYLNNPSGDYFNSLFFEPPSVAHRVKYLICSKKIIKAVTFPPRCALRLLHPAPLAERYGHLSILRKNHTLQLKDTIKQCVCQHPK